MPIIITYVNPNMRPDVVKGESFKQLDENTPHMGVIHMTDLNDGHRIVVNKSNWVKADEIPQDVWDKNVENQRLREEAQAKAQAEAEVKRKADAAAATLALLESKTLKGRIKRLFGRKP